MGVYIKGMEMPQSCRACPFRHETYLQTRQFCIANSNEELCTGIDKIDESCPLVPVPPHGRLVDVSEKIRVQMYDDMTEDYHIAEMTIDDLLSQGWVEADATTIIPAEEGE